jgi:hypothetical protein
MATLKLSYLCQSFTKLHQNAGLHTNAMGLPIIMSPLIIMIDNNSAIAQQK